MDSGTEQATPGVWLIRRQAGETQFTAVETDLQAVLDVWVADLVLGKG
jgi:hypothetical protein